MKSKIEKYKKLESELNQLKEEIETRVEEIGRYMLSNDPELERRKIYGSIDGFTVEKDSIEVNVSEYRGCGEYDYNSFEIDLELFQSDNWLELITDKINKEIAKELRAEKLRQEVEKAKKIESLKKELKKLQEEDKSQKISQLQSDLEKLQSEQTK